MANTKEIQNRIKSVTSTHKITRTMEMVATSRFKKAADAVTSARPFAAALPSMLALLSGDDAASHPLLEVRSEVKRVALLVLTTNRGLCGALNANVLKMTQAFLREHQAAGHEVDLHVVGKKGNSYLRFIGQQIKTSVIDLDDQPGMGDVDRLSTPLVDAFGDGEVDEVYIAYPQFKNPAEQPPAIDRILPLSLTESGDGEQQQVGVQHHFILEPDPQGLLEALLPLFLRNSFFRYLLEMAASEHGARRTAMKAATDSAKEMIDTLTLSFNKARQAQITTELLEVVSGAEALK
jgi:F-type H+-transporting ATPase subunit gamma